MNPARFVSFEGGEGAGKSTQLRLLAERLRAAGIAVETTREPGGTPNAELLRSVLLDPAHDWGARAEAWLFAAARSDHVERLIRPALTSGKWVICDRFVDSSRAYQGGAGGLSDGDILDLHRIGSDGLMPDVTVFLDVDPAVAARRAELRDAGATDRIGGKGAEYHARVRAGFLAFAKEAPDRFACIDGNAGADAVSDAVFAALTQRGLL